MNAIYARQSIDKKDSLSIEGQIALCKKLAGDDAKVYADKGYSGKNIKRPAFTELIEAVKSGTVKKIFVYRLDRFSRSIADFSKLWELLEKYGVEFVSATENFDTSSPMGRAMLNIVLVFAQLERETVSLRVKDNYEHRHMLGAWPGGPAPYGFRLGKITVDCKFCSTLIENENAETVKRIFSMYADSETSLRAIAQILTSENIPGPKRKAWDSVTVSRILHSPLYVMADSDIYWFYIAKGVKISQSEELFDGGHAASLIGRRDRNKGKYNEYSEQTLSLCNHSGFIDSRTWLAVQNKLEQNAQLPRKNAGKYSWLTGLIKCAQCGYALKFNYLKTKNKVYMSCSGRSNFSICDATIGVDIRELEAYVESELCKMLSESKPEGTIPNSKENLKELLSIDLKIERLVNALAESSNVSAAYISAKIDALHEERDNILKSKKSEKRLPETIDFKSLSFEDKKLIAAEFIDKIKIEGKNVEICWKV